MLVKIFTSYDFDSLMPPKDEDYAVNLFRLPRGYSYGIDNGVPYILCPNSTRVYELDTGRPHSGSVKFSYLVDGRKRTVRLYIDAEATRDMIRSGEPYRQLP